MTEPDNQTLVLLRQIRAAVDENTAKLADLKGDVTVLTGIVLRLEGRESGLPVELIGIRLQLAGLQRRVDAVEAAQRSTGAL